LEVPQQQQIAEFENQILPFDLSAILSRNRKCMAPKDHSFIMGSIVFSSQAALARFLPLSIYYDHFETKVAATASFR
jgi:hypothetical protein